MSQHDAEIIKKQYYYRKLILQGRLKLPIDSAKKIVGQDNAYHLYSRLTGNKKRKKKRY